jgi:hypothetical protein
MKKGIEEDDVQNKFLAVVLTLIIIANGIQIYFYKASERFDWRSSVLSSKGNVVQVSSCYFNGNFYDIDKEKIIDDGWEETNDSENNMESVFFPDSLSIEWFSYNERKFYKGVFALPYKTILKKAIQMGMTPSKKKDYSEAIITEAPILYFIAEIQPKGRVIVWLQKFDANYNDTRVQIGKYQAKETNSTWHVFDDISESKTISNVDVPTKVALVMDRYSYKLEINFPSGYILKDSDFYFFNQNDWHFEESEPKVIPIFNSIPKQFDLSWGHGHGDGNFTSQFYFDEKEVLDAFRKVSNNAGKLETLVLELTVNNNGNITKTILKNNKTNLKVMLENEYEP